MLSVRRKKAHENPSQNRVYTKAIWNSTNRQQCIAFYIVIISFRRNTHSEWLVIVFFRDCCSTKAHKLTLLRVAVFGIRLNFSFYISFHLVLIVVLVLLLLLVMVLLSIFRSLPIVTLGVVCSFVRGFFLWFRCSFALLLNASVLHHFKADTLIRNVNCAKSKSVSEIAVQFSIRLVHTRFSCKQQVQCIDIIISLEHQVCVCDLYFIFFSSLLSSVNAMQWNGSNRNIVFYFSMQRSRSEVFCSCFSFIPIFCSLCRCSRESNGEKMKQTAERKVCRRQKWTSESEWKRHRIVVQCRSSRPVLCAKLCCVYCGLCHVVLCYLMRVTFLAITPNYCLRNWKICSLLSLSLTQPLRTSFSFGFFGSFVRSLARSFVSVSFGLPSIGNCSSDCISDPTIFTMTLIPIQTHIDKVHAYISQAGNQFETNETIEWKQRKKEWKINDSKWK